MAEKFYTLQAAAGGELMENMNYGALARSSRDQIREPLAEELSPMPYGTDFFLLPGRDPMGMKKGKKESFFKDMGENVYAVALVPPPGYTRTLLPAYHIKKPEPLPFFAYSMGAFRLKDEEIYIAAVETDQSLRWDPTQYSSVDLKTKIKKKLKAFPENRLLRHLAVCAEEYHCYNAQNIFYDRWEGGIPTSPGCNADCMGCISKKRKKNPPSPQNRIKFTPTVEEIAELAVGHLNMGRAIISFGQGCEGEPLMQGDLIADALAQIRSRTERGTLHINTNGSRPETVKKLAEAGLDSIRISMNSAIKNSYNEFFKPADFTFEKVKESIRIAKNAGLFVSINYLMMPGYNDNEQEAEKFYEFLREYEPHMIQTRNLNIDPDSFYSKMGTLKGKPLGVVRHLRNIRERFPDILIGNFNRDLKD